jgi:hypothetical protein
MAGLVERSIATAVPDHAEAALPARMQRLNDEKRRAAHEIVEP